LAGRVVAEGDVVPLPYIEAGSSYSMAEDSAINVVVTYPAIALIQWLESRANQIYNSL
jgi:hypothetical protein